MLAALIVEIEEEKASCYSQRSPPTCNSSLKRNWSMISKFRIRVTNDRNISSPRAGAPDSAYLACCIIPSSMSREGSLCILSPVGSCLHLSAWSSVSGLGWERDCADLSAWGSSHCPHGGLDHESLCEKMGENGLESLDNPISQLF